ncbi:glycosyltransferase family 9 protein [Sinomonas halotolerans]|uniref:Glycosyltransferase family 9 protein n=1 Tax=Sinomonas halotolerans TaxID=1644133 RepID=A0ABU9X0A9_9MICC
MRRVLVARLDSLGDVVLAGPAVRAVAAHAEAVLLTGPRGSAVAPLLPGVSEHLEWDCPWIGNPPARASEAHLGALERLIAGAGVEEAVILTSFHQSPLPLALELRRCGVARITGLSEDYPGSLLDVRVTSRDLPWELHEADRALGIAAAAGFALPADDDGLPALARTAPSAVRPPGEYVVVHPGADVPARAWPASHAAELVSLLAARGITVVVTGGPGERELTERVAGAAGTDLGGKTDVPALVDVLAGASAVVVGNTGPAHLAAAVRTPVVSLFSPVVSAQSWGPRGGPSVLLGQQDEACAGSRARECPVPGHPCLASVTPEDVLAALAGVTGLAGLAGLPTAPTGAVA